MAAGAPGREPERTSYSAELGRGQGQRAEQLHAAAAEDVRLDLDRVLLALHRPEAGQEDAGGGVPAERCGRLPPDDEFRPVTDLDVEADELSRLRARAV